MQDFTNGSIEDLVEFLPIIAPLILIQLILMIIAIISLIKADDTNGPKPIWAVIIVFLTFIGPILYFIVGRRQS
ncbi:MULTISPECIES: PLD nuclease N-terminal domain-containing protein [Gracilibacillus]|uniref:Cardiolipin synthase N-terminal domain-containing protein n=1 Tax=Gracilibacillus dipsosauri TaxID=178340 RepID=A0A317KTR4_9BACI|nr:PLD nuclease N-terminal domain-containing protein [Gracilibacillus dipsosauri]PWU66857.1 hypothetical protein DLJ74_18510 [Gracilibacillus dipsosauri]